MLGLKYLTKIFYNHIENEGRKEGGIKLFIFAIISYFLLVLCQLLFGENWLSLGKHQKEVF